MKLTNEQSAEILARPGIWVNEACDKCSALLGPVRFTRRGETGVYCSRECRDGVKIAAPQNCRQCDTPLVGKRRGAQFCGDTCRKRYSAMRGKSPMVLNPEIIAETHIQNKGLSEAQNAS